MTTYWQRGSPDRVSSLRGPSVREGCLRLRAAPRKRLRCGGALVRKGCGSSRCGRRRRRCCSVLACGGAFGQIEQPITVTLTTRVSVTPEPRVTLAGPPVPPGRSSTSTFTVLPDTGPPKVNRPTKESGLLLWVKSLSLTTTFDEVNEPNQYSTPQSSTPARSSKISTRVLPLIEVSPVLAAFTQYMLMPAP